MIALILFLEELGKVVIVFRLFLETNLLLNLILELLLNFLNGFLNGSFLLLLFEFVCLDLRSHLADLNLKVRLFMFHLGTVIVGSVSLL